MTKAIRFSIPYSIAQGITVLLIASTAISCRQKSELIEGVVEGALAAPPQLLAIKIKDYRPQNGNTFQHLFVSNFSVKVVRGKLLPSTARDGMPDDLKVALAPDYSISPISAESAVTGFADLLLFYMGIKIPQQNLLHCSGNQLLSSSNDAFIYNDARQGGLQEFLGLRDCEKIYMGLDPKKFDYTGGGIPDYMSLRCGLNPLDKVAPFLSTAGDGISNMDKCKRNIPIDEDGNDQPGQLYSYQYKTTLMQDGTSEFDIKNMPILNDGEGQFIAFYVVEKNTTTNASSLFTAYAIMKAGYSGRTLELDYWATAPARYNNAEIVVP